MKGANILVVDDEDNVRKLVTHILAPCDYHFLEARQGEEALALSESFPGPIHLLITDIMMPVMNGRELASRLSSLRPGIRVLFLSGYPGDHLPRIDLQKPKIEFLPKPFTPEGLLQKVAGLLG